MKAIIVRPGEMSGRVFYRGFRKHNQYALPYRARGKKVPFPGYAVNRNTLMGIFSYLHHYADHSPPAVAKRWRAASRRFERHHFAMAGNGTARFLNTYTAHAWM